MKCTNLSTYLEKFNSKKIRNEKVSDLCYGLYYKQFFDRSVFSHSFYNDGDLKKCSLIFNENNINDYWRNKALKLRDCGTFLNFARNINDIDDISLVGANFCRLRICPMCTWRRQLKLYTEMTKTMEYITDKEKLLSLDIPKKYKHKEINYHFLIVTFTLKNCSGDDLGNTIDKFIHSYTHKLMKTKRIKSVVYGAYRALEVTYNKEAKTFHPHIHAIWAVSGRYFKDKGKYISQNELADLWQLSTDIDYTPVVDIRKIKSCNDMTSDDIGKAVAEVCKYPVKDTDFCDYDNFEDSFYVLETLDNFLKGRRLVGFSGLFKDVRKFVLENSQQNICLTDSCKELLDDANVENEYIIDSYIWRSGYHFADFGEKYFDWYKAFHGKSKNCY